MSAKAELAFAARQHGETMAIGGTKQDGTDQTDFMRVDNFDAQARRITPEDRVLLHELTVGVFWQHRAPDLDSLIAIGEGYLATDEIGRAMGSAMCFRAEDNFAMLGMMVTAPRLQTLGTGRWLLRRVMADCAGADLRLSATRSGYRLYESEGFVPLRTVGQHQGIARAPELPDPVPGVTLRTLTQADEPAVRALDRQAYGAERRRTLDTILALSSGLVAEKAGEIVGYGLVRPFGRGVVIGPLVAGDDRIATMLAAPLIQRHVGSFVRLDTPIQGEAFTGFLEAAGLGRYDTVTEMYRGKQRRPLEGTQVYALAAHPLG
ncbi:GNAT family N-acetyltransferase [Kaustia mangrovi]|uniref:GNAT family N-acetyltransferase n=1 Tax=Kaustia mangrovi TaxID=2593653 RepID=A0A7S8HAX3_9HYPH|nr:GNAT family N-acetyltransferase [Kaustia mangrovi]QPC41533.1 GNAT family N-acetyltransferase [Kaustia mangrovi]